MNKADYVTIAIILVIAIVGCTIGYGIGKLIFG